MSNRIWRKRTKALTSTPHEPSLDSTGPLPAGLQVSLTVRGHIPRQEIDLENERTGKEGTRHFGIASLNRESNRQKTLRRRGERCLPQDSTNHYFESLGLDSMAALEVVAVEEQPIALAMTNAAARVRTRNFFMFVVLFRECFRMMQPVRPERNDRVGEAKTPPFREPREVPGSFRDVPSGLFVSVFSATPSRGGEPGPRSGKHSIGWRFGQSVILPKRSNDIGIKTGKPILRGQEFDDHEIRASGRR